MCREGHGDPGRPGLGWRDRQTGHCWPLRRLRLDAQGFCLSLHSGGTWRRLVWMLRPDVGGFHL
jgi:hypothetical protein